MFRRITSLLLAGLLVFSLFFSIGGDNFAFSYYESDGPDDEAVFVQDEVIALADSLEHALFIADEYDLELVSFAHGVAILQTDDPEREVDESEADPAAGVPDLSLNFVYELFETYQTASTAQWHRNEMEIDAAHRLGHSGAGVVVAVIDTGIDINHRAFTGRISSRSYNAVTNNIGTAHVRDDHHSSHGTHISGIIGAARDNSFDVIGAAPGSTIMAIKANNPGTDVFALSSIISGINYAVDNGAKVINLSLGRPTSGGESSVERTAIRNAVNNGFLVVCAAGNESQAVSYPAAYPESIAVSATQQGFAFASTYSSYGPAVDISAPGSSIYSTIVGGSYGYMSGTSMAAGNVSGVAALLIGQLPSRTVQQVRNILLQTARDAGAVGFDIYFGNGIVNAFAAVQAIGTNPPQIELLTGFVERLYVNILGRASDTGGMNFWRNGLSNGTMTGKIVSEEFFFSTEYIRRNRTNTQFVNDLYETCMDRSADIGGRNFWVNLLNNGYSRRFIMFEFLGSPEFREICRRYGILP